MSTVKDQDTLTEYWENLSAEKRFKAIEVYDDLCDWIKQKVESREEVPEILIDKKIIQALDDMKDVYLIPECMSALMYLTFSDRPIPNSGLTERFQVRVMENNAVIRLYKECIYYKNEFDKPGYDGPARTIWEENNDLHDAESRYEFAKYTLSYRGFI